MSQYCCVFYPIRGKKQCNILVFGCGFSHDALVIKWLKPAILCVTLNAGLLLSGLAINYDKTKGMWIGTSRKNKTKPLGIKWPSEPIKIDR